MYQIFKCKIKSFKALKIILIKNLFDMEICFLNKRNHPKVALEKIKFDYIKFLCFPYTMKNFKNMLSSLLNRIIFFTDNKYEVIFYNHN